VAVVPAASSSLGTVKMGILGSNPDPMKQEF
jgi:hypothetical protein